MSMEQPVKIEFDDTDRYSYLRRPSPRWIYGFPTAVPHNAYSKQDADTKAAQLAASRPGETVYVYAAVAAFQTSPVVTGQRFDPNVVAPEPIDVSECPEPVEAPASLSDEGEF